MARFCGRKGVISFDGVSLDAASFSFDADDDGQGEPLQLERQTITVDFTIDEESQRDLDRWFWWLRLADILRSHFSEN
jgi:hypothetical protein